MPPGVIPPELEEFLHGVTLFEIVFWCVVAFVVIKWGRKWWRALVATARGFLAVAATLESIHGLTDFMARTDATLADQDLKIADMHHELSYNKETSVKDAIRRVELGVKGLYDRADASDKSDQELRDELERTRPPFSPPSQGATQ